MTEPRTFWGKIWQKEEGSEVKSDNLECSEVKSDKLKTFWDKIWQKLESAEVKSDRNLMLLR